jgi:hypothetical protein
MLRPASKKNLSPRRISQVSTNLVEETARQTRNQVLVTASRPSGYGLKARVSTPVNTLSTRRDKLDSSEPAGWSAVPLSDPRKSRRCLPDALFCSHNWLAWPFCDGLGGYIAVLPVSPSHRFFSGSEAQTRQECRTAEAKLDLLMRQPSEPR